MSLNFHGIQGFEGDLPAIAVPTEAASASGAPLTCRSRASPRARDTSRPPQVMTVITDRALVP